MKRRAENSERCALCAAKSDLRKSHVLPAWAYADIRRSNPGQKDPVLLEKDVALATSKQLRVRMLCEGCEQRFSRRENIAKSYTLTESGCSRLHELPRARSGFVSTPTVSILDAGTADHESLTYFAVSVVWRAAVATKRGFGECYLGPYEDAIRPYLRDEATIPSTFVVNLEVMSIADDSVLHRIATFPKTIRAKSSHVAYFFVSGLHFLVYTGSRISPDVVATSLSSGPEYQCRVRSPDSMLFMDGLKRRIYQSHAKGALRDSGVWNPDA